MKVGDLVTRKSHGHDIVFKIIDIQPDGFVRLKGHHWRLEADAPIHDLSRAYISDSAETWMRTRERVVTAKRALYYKFDRRFTARSNFRNT